VPAWGLVWCGVWERRVVVEWDGDHVRVHVVRWIHTVQKAVVF